MPANSKRQLRLIYSKRNKYKTEKNTPKNWKWVWDKEWTDVNYKKLPEKVKEHIITKFNRFLNESIYESDDEHIGSWYHGGTGKFLGGNFLYVTDELKEAIYYAKLKGGNVYKLKDQYNNIVDWSIDQSEGMISQEKLIENGGFDNIFEVYDDLNESIKNILKPKYTDSELLDIIKNMNNQKKLEFASKYGISWMVKDVLKNSDDNINIYLPLRLAYDNNHYDIVNIIKNDQRYDDPNENKSNKINRYIHFHKYWESFVSESKKQPKVKTKEKIAELHGLEEKELDRWIKAALKFERKHTDNAEVARNIVLKNLEQNPKFYHEKFGEQEMNNIIKQIEREEKEEKNKN